MLTPDVDRLERVLKDIFEHGGAVTLHRDWVWLQAVQQEKPEWAATLLNKYKELHLNKL